MCPSTVTAPDRVLVLTLVVGCSETPVSGGGKRDLPFSLTGVSLPKWLLTGGTGKNEVIVSPRILLPGDSPAIRT